MITDMALGTKKKAIEIGVLTSFYLGLFFVIVGLVEDTNIIYNLINNF
jgi:hypothetical protein